jgi:hypothetical protein
VFSNAAILQHTNLISDGMPSSARSGKSETVSLKNKPMPPTRNESAGTTLIQS